MSTSARKQSRRWLGWWRRCAAAAFAFIGLTAPASEAAIPDVADRIARIRVVLEQQTADVPELVAFLPNDDPDQWGNWGNWGNWNNWNNWRNWGNWGNA